MIFYYRKNLSSCQHLQVFSYIITGEAQCFKKGNPGNMDFSVVVKDAKRKEKQVYSIWDFYLLF